LCDCRLVESDIRHYGLSSSACQCRDVKPENIVLEDSRSGGRVYLVDFGGVQVHILYSVLLRCIISEETQTAHPTAMHKCFHVMMCFNVRYVSR
jgi:serine/threonine protein kinase